MIINEALFKMPSQREYRKFKQKGQLFMPTFEAMGTTEERYSMATNEERANILNIYNLWMEKVFKERAHGNYLKLEERSKKHWHRTLSKEKQKDLIIRSLVIKHRVVSEMIARNPRSISIYLQAEQASEETFNFKDIDTTNLKKLPQYNEEHDCLCGGNTLFIYLWIAFFNKRKGKSEKNLY